MNTTPENNDSNQSANSPSETPSLPTRSIVTIAIVAVVLLGVLGVGVALTRGGSSSADIAGETTTTSGAGSSSTTTAGTSGSTVTTSVPCAQGAWPKAFAGKPDGLTQPSAAAFFIWSDSSGFHIRGIDPLGTTPFSGTITAGNALTEAAVVKTTSEDVTTSVSNNTISFSFDASSLAAGFDFSLCQSMQASITVNSANEQWPAQRILIGTNGRAVANPVLLSRS